MAGGSFLDRTVAPSMAAFASAVGDRRAVWDRIVGHLATVYGLQGEPLFYGRDAGWVLRYRRSGRTLLVLLPEAGAFRALVVVGPSIAEAAAALPLELGVRAALEHAHAYPDGRWIWIDVASEAVADDVVRLVELKSPPPRRPRRGPGAILAS